jgi:hypothetical protein
MRGSYDKRREAESRHEGIEVPQYMSRLLREKLRIASSINIERRPWQTTMHGQVVDFKKTVFRLYANNFSHVEVFARGRRTHSPS